MPSLTEMALNDAAPDFGREHKTFMKKPFHFGQLNITVERVRSATGQLILDANHPEVRKRLQEGIDIARDILQKMGAKRISGGKIGGGYIGVETGTADCRAGADKSNSVINSDFESHDVENLFICDGSVMPCVPAVFGQGGSAIAMLACHASQRIVAKHFSRA